MDEQRAIQLCLKHRDPIGFEFLVRKYRREAFVHARALLGNEQDALDACQDAFLKPSPSPAASSSNRRIARVCSGRSGRCGRNTARFSQ
jgi:hypothetical protein